MTKPTSTTKQVSDTMSLFHDKHYETRIVDRSGNVYDGLGATAEQAQQRAAEKLVDRTPTWSPSGSSSSGESSGGSSSGGCYLTTACTRARGLPDNCLELGVLRAYRDKILLPTSKGRRAVAEYYKMAPEIVGAVNEREDAQKIWQATYEEIGRAVTLVLAGNYNGAFKHYRGMGSRLKEKYLV